MTHDAGVENALTVAPASGHPRSSRAAAAAVGDPWSRMRQII